jgi:hypothetical protein
VTTQELKPEARAEEAEGPLNEGPPGAVPEEPEAHSEPVEAEEPAVQVPSDEATAEPAPEAEAKPDESEQTVEAVAEEENEDQESAPAPPEGTQRVTLEVFPWDAEIYRFGKRIGQTRVSLDVPEGERIRLEIGRAGYVTRKLVVDGSEDRLFVGLKETAKAPAKAPVKASAGANATSAPAPSAP